MKLKLKHNINNRFEFAYLIARLIAGQDFHPWKPNEHDDEFWKVDAGNDWSITFFPVNKNLFEIKYRYDLNNIKQVPALANWLVVRLDAQIISQ